MKNGIIVGLALTASASALAQHAPPTPAQIAAVEASLHPQSGDVAVPGAGVTLHLGRDFTYLTPADAKRVLTEIWGNPPSTGEGVLGIVLPAGKSASQSVWGAVITYENSGYVTDDDAQTADYNAILGQLRAGEEDNNRRRREQGYPAMHLVGWAQQPSYDRATHSVIWARDLRLDGVPGDSLNYDVRLLGRGGVLSMNMLAGIGDLAEVRQAAAAVGRTATFDTGQRYADFNDAKGDKRAGYGLAGLVAAGVGVAAAKKLGFLAIVLGFGKKFLVVFAVAAAAAKRFFGKIFGKKDAA